MLEYTQDSLAALSNFSLFDSKLTEQIFIKYGYIRYILEMSFSDLNVPYLTLGILLKDLPTLKEVIPLFNALEKNMFYAQKEE